MSESVADTKSSITWGMILLGAFIVAALAFMAKPVILKAKKNAPMTSATSNAKQVFYLLIEFDQDYGEFPSDGTAVIYRDEQGEVDVDLSSFKGEYSNDYLRQLIAAGLIKSEEIFTVPKKGGKSRRVDNVISPREKILEAGECWFGYVKNQSTSDNSGRPVLMTPMIGKGVSFDPIPFNGKAVVLRIDGAVRQLLLDKASNAAKIGGGKTLFQPGEDTVWGEKGFNVENLCLPKMKAGE